jgi:hypothetical protein
VLDLVRSNDLVYLSWREAVLAAQGIPYVGRDAFTSAIEGSIGAITRRVMVAAEDAERVRRAGEAAA